MPRTSLNWGPLADLEEEARAGGQSQGIPRVVGRTGSRGGGGRGGVPPWLVRPPVEAMAQSAWGTLTGAPAWDRRWDVGAALETGEWAGRTGGWPAGRHPPRLGPRSLKRPEDNGRCGHRTARVRDRATRSQETRWEPRPERHLLETGMWESPGGVQGIESVRMRGKGDQPAELGSLGRPGGRAAEPRPAREREALLGVGLMDVF